MTIYGSTKKAYNKLYQRYTEKTFVMAWSILCHRNDVTFRNMDAHPAHVTNLVVKFSNDMRYYSVISNGRYDITGAQPIPKKCGRPFLH